MKNLIVTADDFGLAPSVNEGIMRALKEGVVTYLALMPTGEAFEEAVSLSRENNIKELDAHLSLTQDRPVTDPSKIPTLVTNKKYFNGGYATLLGNMLLGRVSRDEMYLELRNQLDKVKGTGIRVTSLSSHEHIHIAPDILKIFVRLAGEYNILFIRYPHRDITAGSFGLKRFYKSIVLKYFESAVKETLDRAGIAYSDYMTGFLDSGKMDEPILIEIISRLPEGTTELVCHPGFLGPEVLSRYRFHINCEAELYALTSPRVKKLIRDRNIRLTTFGELQP